MSDQLYLLIQSWLITLLTALDGGETLNSASGLVLITRTDAGRCLLSSERRQANGEKR